MVTVKFSSSPPSLEEDTQGENVSAVINFGRTGGYLDQQSAHNELARKHHSSRNLKRKKQNKKQTRRTSLSARHAHQLRRQLCQIWKRHQRPSLAIAWIPANGLCDIQTVTDGYEMKGSLSLSLLFFTETTAHSAPDHQTDVLCAVQHILDSCDPPSCPRSPRLLGWHPRQKSHHSHDMVAPRP